MANRLCIQITEKDNVAIAIHDLKKGTEVMPGVVTAVDIPQAHKIALEGDAEGHRGCTLRRCSRHDRGGYPGGRLDQ